MHPLSALPPPLLALLLTSTLILAKTDTPKVEIETSQAVDCSRPTRPGDEISVHYRGSLQSNGVIFDESYKRGKPITFTLGAHHVIKGWEQGLLDMCPGEGRILTIPPELGYGARGAPPAIPGGATLVFETELVDIVGVEQESLSVATSATEEAFSIATAPPEPPVTEGEKMGDEQDSTDNASTPTDLDATPLPTAQEQEQGECHLLGSFALIVQAALGAAAILALVYKRWRETAKRPWKIWFFDVSKQVLGSMLTHVLNLAMSELGAMDDVNAAKNAASKGKGGEDGEPTPNPCSFYLLNLGIDTTLGIPILYLLLKILHVAFRYTPLAQPPSSIKSGNYGQPPRATWWLKQSLIYFLGLTGMKMFVWVLFAILPWLPWVGDWALRWTEGNEALQIAFTMFIFPLLMNGLQYWIIDNLIMDQQRGKEGEAGYQQVLTNDDDEDGLHGSHDFDDDDEVTVVTEESIRGKDSGDEVVPPSLKEVNPTPIPLYDGEGDGRTVSPHKENERGG